MGIINTNNRFSSLDIMRGIAVVFMIEAHIRILPMFLDLRVYSDILAAPFFLIAAGTGYQLFLHSRMKKGLKNKSIFLEAFWRAIILFLVTTGLFIIGTKLFPLAVADIGILKWNVFQVIAVGYIFGFLIYDSINRKIVAIIALFCSSFLISNYQLIQFYFLSKGFLPLIPWLSYFIFGQLVYEIYKKRNLSLKINQNIVGYSSLFLFLNLLIMYIFPYEFISAGRANFPEFLMISSIFLFISVLILRWVDLKTMFKRIFIPFESIGRIAFTAYYLQMLFLVVLSYNAFFQKIPSGSANLLILIAMITALTLFEKVWRKYGYILGLEWILRKGTFLMMNSKKYFK